MPILPPTYRPRHLPSLNERRHEHDVRRDKAEQRRWYKTAAWRRLKDAVHIRDGFICQATGISCSGTYPADNSPVADHIVEPEGDPTLFWSLDNVRTVSKSYHDSERQKEQIAERGRGAVRKSRGAQG